QRICGGSLDATAATAAAARQRRNEQDGTGDGKAAQPAATHKEGNNREEARRMFAAPAYRRNPMEARAAASHSDDPAGPFSLSQKSAMVSDPSCGGRAPSRLPTRTPSSRMRRVSFTRARHS